MSEVFNISTFKDERFNKEFNVLSLFDGMSCLQIALEVLGLKPTMYFASEIKKIAVDFTQHNFPSTIQLGDVMRWRDWELPRIDLIAFGSPCQDFSRLNVNPTINKGLYGDKSSLFYVAFDILNHLRKTNPDILFLAENVMGSDIIGSYLRVEPIYINNLEFAPSRRNRLFFTNIAAEKLSDVMGQTYYKRTIPDSTVNNNITLKLDEPLLSDPYLWVKDDQANRFFSNPLTTGILFTDGQERQAGCMTRQRKLNKFGFSMVHQKGRYRYHTEGELRQMHSIPDFVQFPNQSLHSIQDLIGDGWAVGSACYVLKHLKA